MTQATFDFIADEPPLQVLRRRLDALEKFQVDIEQALCYGGNTHSFDDVAAGVLSGEYAMFTNPEAVIITEVMNYPLMRTLHVFIAAGKMEKVFKLHPDLVRYAKAIGASKLTLVGRKGWERAALTYGWNPTLTVMERAV